MKAEDRPERLTYTVAEAAAAIGVSREYGYAMARDGRIPTIRIGRRILVPRYQLEELINNALPGIAL